MSENEPIVNDDVVLLFYRQVIALAPERHGSLKIGAIPNHHFTSHINSVPLSGVEFGEAGKEYPIVFNRDGTGVTSAVAVLGLENNENLFLGKEQEWKANYLPAFVRRYPFILGTNPESPGQAWVCVDETCPWLGSDQGESLFEGDRPSPFLEQIIAFLNDYSMQLERTAVFGRKLADWGLLKESQAQATTADGRSYTLTGIWTVDESALAQLEADKLQELLKTGELAWIFFHLASLSNFRLLAERKSARVATGLLH
jgi:hypothetical protein